MSKGKELLTKLRERKNILATNQAEAVIQTTPVWGPPANREWSGGFTPGGLPKLKANERWRNAIVLSALRKVVKERGIESAKEWWMKAYRLYPESYKGDMEIALEERSPAHPPKKKKSEESRYCIDCQTDLPQGGPKKHLMCRPCIRKWVDKSNRGWK